MFHRISILCLLCALALVGCPQSDRKVFKAKEAYYINVRPDLESHLENQMDEFARRNSLNISKVTNPEFLDFFRETRGQDRRTLKNTYHRYEQDNWISIVLSNTDIYCGFDIYFFYDKTDQATDDLIARIKEVLVSIDLKTGIEAKIGSERRNQVLIRDGSYQGSC